VPSRIGEARVAGSANKVEKVRVYLPLLFRESGCNVLKVGTVRDARQGGTYINGIYVTGSLSEQDGSRW
jgi:hypothetical protein